MIVCDICGHDNEPADRLCGSCGAPLEELTTAALHPEVAAGSTGGMDRLHMHRGGPVDLDELETLARAATPGPWTSWIEGRDHSGGDHFVEVNARDAPDLYPRVVVESREWNPNWRADQDYIAAANPETILQLIRLVRQTRQS